MCFYRREAYHIFKLMWKIQKSEKNKYFLVFLFFKREAYAYHIFKLVWKKSKIEEKKLFLFFRREAYASHHILELIWKKSKIEKKILFFRFSGGRHATPHSVGSWVPGRAGGHPHRRHRSLLSKQKSKTFQAWQFN